jgi:hypothetical protein
VPSEFRQPQETPVEDALSAFIRRQCQEDVYPVCKLAQHRSGQSGGAEVRCSHGDYNRKVKVLDRDLLGTATHSLFDFIAEVVLNAVEQRSLEGMDSTGNPGYESLLVARPCLRKG